MPILPIHEILIKKRTQTTELSPLYDTPSSPHLRSRVVIFPFFFQPVADASDDWTAADRTAIFCPSSSPPGVDLPDDDEIDEIAMAIGNKPVESVNR